MGRMFDLSSILRYAFLNHLTNMFVMPTGSYTLKDFCSLGGIVEYPKEIISLLHHKVIRKQMRKNDLIRNVGSGNGRNVSFIVVFCCF